MGPAWDAHQAPIGRSRAYVKKGSVVRGVKHWPTPPPAKKKKKKKEKETLSYVTWDLVNLLFKSSELICSSYVALIQKILVSSWGSWLHMLFFFKFMEIKLLCNHVNCLDKPQSKAQYVFFLLGIHSPKCQRASKVHICIKDTYNQSV